MIKIEWNKSNPPDKRFLIGVLIFGILYAAVGCRWLSSGSIVIGEGRSSTTEVASQESSRVAGIIKEGDALFYPLCASWILLGASMVVLTPLALFGSREIFLRLASYSCLMVILLGFGTVGAAIWYGP